MKTKTLGWMMALGAGLTATAFAACSQPKTDCQVALASTFYSYAVVYKVKTPPSAECSANVKKGELVAMEFYHPPTSDKSTYDSTKTTAALKTEEIQNYLDTWGSVGAGDPCDVTVRCTQDTDCSDDGSIVCKQSTQVDGSGFCLPTSCSDVHTPYSYGAFTSYEPDANDMCTIKTLSETNEELQASEDTVGAVDPTTPCTMDADCRPDTGTACTSDDDCIAEADTEVCGPAGTCVDTVSGSVCDTATSLCVAGCRATDNGNPAANSCLAPYSCTSSDDTVGSCALPADTIKYAWSNLSFYTTAAAPGTQFAGDVTITEGGCTIEYTAIGMWPGVPCAEDIDCSPCARPDAGVTVGSGISPDFPTRCDTDLGMCVLADAKNPANNADTIPQTLGTSIDCGPVD